MTYKYLRLSVTDRCNLACKYCIRGCDFFRKGSNLLSFKEIVRAVSLLSDFGIKHVRITGGEPLLRQDLAGLIQLLAPIGDFMAITTNGTCLANQALQLASAGLKLVNVHLDTIKNYKWLTGGEITPVLKGIEAAMANGIKLKLNAVLLKGINDDEIVDLAGFAAKLGVPIRFIELMPFCDAKFYKNYFVSADVVYDRLSLEPFLNNDLGRGPANYYIDAKTGATVGIINPISKKFCGDCDRLRLTSTGYLKRCLARCPVLSLRDCGFDKTVVKNYLVGKEYDHGGFGVAPLFNMQAIGG